ncbi:heme o synthase [Caldifermentibacillus hisashii]|uniref:heme o synthase n=1 Tax=Caldifermentibacillus hisashii TaxID=996558 RepID=UPI003D226BC8
MVLLNQKKKSENNTLYRTKNNKDQTSSTFFKDFLLLIKIGITNSNSITAFAGICLAMFYNNLGFMDNLIAVILGTIGIWFVIAGSASFNNYIDRDIDVKMKRTTRRPTVSGRFSLPFVLIVSLSFITIGLVLLSQTSIMAGIIGALGSFAYIVLYTIWTKRRYTINTVVGSLSGAVPPLIGWATIDPNLHPAAWGLFLIMFIWQIPHFLALAIKKKEDYRKAGIPMLPVVYGNAITKRQIMLWILCLLPTPIILYRLGIPFFILATGLNVGWIITGIIGFRTMDDNKWASKMFIYSLNYLTILFVAMVVFTMI